MFQILSELKQQGYDQQSLLKQQQINAAFDKIISTGIIERQFPREVLQEMWQMTEKNDDNEVRLEDFVERMQKKNKLQYLPDRKDSIEKAPSVANGQGAEQNQLRIQQFDAENSVQVRNLHTNDSVSYNINATVASSVMQSQSIVSDKKENKSNMKENYQSPIKKKTKSKNTNSNSKKKELSRPLLHHESQLTQQQIEDQLVRDIDRPKLKTKSIILPSSKKASVVQQNSKSLLSSQQSRDKLTSDSINGKQSEKPKKCISKKWLIPMCLFALGIVIFLGSFIIHAQLKQLAIQQVILSPQNQGVWAHFPGDSKAQINRNWTFFNITNADNMLFYNQKPRFRQIQGYKIVELQDYLNITYIQDGDRVQMVDWLHFIEQQETRNLDQKVKVLNVGGLAYWYNIKIARPTIILQQGLSLLFTTLQSSILENIYAQAINMLFLTQFNDDMYSTIFAPAAIPFDEAVFIWQDPAYGIGNQNNIKYWLEAIPSAEEQRNETVSEGFLFLKSYFTLRTQQLNFIISQLKSYVEFTKSAVLDNNYCQNVRQCSGRYLAYQQFATSFVTRNPPPGKDLQSNDTICMSNSTCAGYFPQLEAYYRNVHLERYPDMNSTLEFLPDWMKNLVNYNLSIQEGYDYNTAENCLFHIGNLDALWDNGTLYEESIKSHQQKQENVDAFSNKYLKNIQTRFNLPSTQHAQVFWKWIQYLSNEVILRNQTNEKLGVANLFSTGLYQGFSYLQDNLQNNLLTELIHYDLVEKENHGDCVYFVMQSLQINNTQKALKICDKYGQKIQKQLISDLLSICSNQYRHEWWGFKNTYQLSSLNLLSLCDPEQQIGSFGYLLHMRRKYLNNLYDCSITPKEYCSDYELAAIQWATSRVTLNPPVQLASIFAKKSFTYKQWDLNASRFEYSFYKSKYPQDNDFPNITIKEAYELLNFDNWFSASVMLKQFVDEEFSSKFKQYMRFVGIEVGLNGLTMERSARQLIFGYEDEILKGIKQNYPPFGGDPSTPSLVAFNDPNITKENATMTLEWSTGKYNSSLVGQYRKINGHPYLTVEKDFFNGNTTTTSLQSPWQGQDYVFGTSAKLFAPNQFDQPNISLYVPNIQRYGSGVIEQDSMEQRFGFQLQVGYLGEYIYLSTSQSDINKKYYQNFHAIFNETSVVGFPLYVCKNHFMNVSSNWSMLVEIYDENETVMYENASKYDESFIVVEPYTGVSFQSTVYLQSNYYHTHDSLLTFYTESLLPIFSLARSGNITDEVANDLLGPLKMGLVVVKWTKIIGIIIVVVSSLVCGIIYYQKKKLEKKQEEAETETSVDEQNQQSQKYESPKRQIKSSQLGISLQPMSKDLIRQTSERQEYVPPPVTEQEM